MGKLFNSRSLGILGRKYSRLAWLTGEIFIQKGLDNLLSIDRSKFVEGPDYDQFSEFMRGRLSHYANHVEAISEAERDIKRQLTNSRAAKVGAKREIINQKIEQLENKGFKIVRQSSAQIRQNSSPVKVDFDKNVVHVIENHPDLSDTIRLENENIPLTYKKQGLGNNAAIKRGNDGFIEINSDYALFSSKRYGEVFKKFLLIVFLLSEEHESSKDLLNDLLKKLPKEFGDLLR